MPADVTALRAVLERFLVPRDALLVVHSAIAILSRQGFRAEDMIEMFLEHVRDGGLFMPTMTWRSVTPANPNWDEMATPSHTGILSEIFRTKYSMARSIHPTHSVAGWGGAAKALLSRHHVDDTPVSGNSPYGLMRDYNTYVLMLGVGLEAVTAIHLPEETINVELYVRPRAEAESYSCCDRHGAVHQVSTRRHCRLDRDFPKFEAPLAAKKQLMSGDIAGCRYRIVKLSDLLREVFAALLADPRATLRNGA